MGFIPVLDRVGFPPDPRLTAPAKPDSKPPEVLVQHRIAHDDQPFAAPPRLHRGRGLRMPPKQSGRFQDSLHATLRYGPPGSGVRPLADRSDIAARADAAWTSARQPAPERRTPRTDQNLRPAGQGHPGSPQRKSMGDDSRPASLSEGLRSNWIKRVLKISVPLVPPNPKEFDRAERSGMRRAALAHNRDRRPDPG